ncbi:MAG: chemoreceptor glutamine deamidase CheD [Shewanella algae]|uniref:chemotaxis protein CheD n=1 Tax=Shewanella TaxID=22 RepID=UPI000468CA51|nr:MULTISPECIES: chemotaxis protein CheD [Shewanella]MBO2567937.1 chemoreceptor glutamine deamidase CheD [Shewanella algae]MBO2589465.1 chemoreceptor glutamine deamidase CheD [Shewanella algae]MBO2635621.1 chemoreceptor glutamine deamidase CheD [Shewanella algae]MBO2660996.1 chemoreceptor glutamine deamidase CheD [Shewanella algae]MCL1053886.1 chemoreceptor glutamine deamidase CheD [Shewanella algae]
MQGISEAYKGFEGTVRQWDERFGKVVARVDPGDFYITGADEYIFTRLGSCVAACIWDPVLGIGGLNHFLLPERKLHEDWHQLTSYSCRYGNWAMEQLINAILCVGGQRHRLQAKVFGGARMGQSSVLNVGQSNIDFVLRYLELEQIPVQAEDLGGPWPRKVMFHPNSGKVLLKHMDPERLAQLVPEENRYLDQIVDGKDQPSIELFGPDAL